MPSVQELYRASFLLAQYGTVDTAHADGQLNPCCRRLVRIGGTLYIQRVNAHAR